jgi:hypothetical protein
MAPTGSVLGVGHERQVASSQIDQGRLELRFAAKDHQAASDIVDAIAVLSAWDHAAGVFEEPGVIAETEQMIE